MHSITTQLEEQQLIPQTLDVEHWELDEQEISGKMGNEQVKSAELMFLYGDPFAGNIFEAKPQFYRYF
ncbi:hypothetical protein ACEV7Y_23825, partial [Vibrio parahaemolyticus]